MSKRATPTHVWTFAVILCIVCGCLLTFVAEGLRQRRQINQLADIKKHILKVVNLRDVDYRTLSQEQIVAKYDQVIQEMAVNDQGRTVKIQDSQKQKQYRIYVYYENGHILAYCFPFSGTGLWSQIEGFLALEADGETIRGITFAKHGETPGLGAEIDAPAFQQGFIGKKVFHPKKKKFIALDVLKGQGVERLEKQRQAFSVDGITGATMTTDGVEKMLAECIRVYTPFLKRVKGL